MFAGTPSTSLAAGCWLVIPVHNRAATTAQCLRHLRHLHIPQWMRVVVVNDGSTDDTAAVLAAEFPWVTVLQGDGSLWWAGAVCLGMTTAIRNGARCVCWLNDDTLPAAGSLERLVNHALENEAICGGVCPTGDLSGFTYGGGRLARGWPQACAPMPQPGHPITPVEWLHGNLVAVPACVWQRIGLPDSRWAKHHFADVEYTHRAALSGIPVLLLPDAVGKAQWNASGSYLSWRDPQLSVGAVISGFWNPKMWWYAPGVAYFQIRTFGLAGLCRFLLLFPKAFAVVLFKWLPMWGSRPDKSGQR